MSRVSGWPLAGVTLLRDQGMRAEAIRHLPLVELRKKFLKNLLCRATGDSESNSNALATKVRVSGLANPNQTTQKDALRPQSLHSEMLKSYTHIDLYTTSTGP